MGIRKGSVKQEQDTIRKMINIYCRNKHQQQDNPYSKCQDLLAYAKERLNKCKFGDDKPTCKKCSIHCYRPYKRKK